MQKLVFPSGMLWGAATSSHQVEGNNVHNDWWQWEQAGGGAEPSGDACRHYELFEQDFDLCHSLGHTCHRFSIEWSRIQPDADTFSEKEIAHYSKVIDALRARGIEPVVTLHHFTDPVWFEKAGGWRSPRAPEYFLRYARRMAEEFGARVKWWVTINEPMVLLYYGYIRGTWPPFSKSLAGSRTVYSRLVRSHVLAYRAIHCHYKKRGLPAPMVSIAHNMVAFVPCRRESLLDRIAAGLRHRGYNLEILRELCRRRAIDYIGLNYYTRNLIHARGCSVEELLIKTCRHNHDTLPKNCMGWELYPQGFLDIIRALARFSLPVFILENGICTENDAQRWEFIRDHLAMLHKAIEEGSRVAGYCYWSLLDNFEWDKGFRPRFGIVGVDYATKERRVRESGLRYAAVCKTGTLEA
jgi:beta-glucosidase